MSNKFEVLQSDSSLSESIFSSIKMAIIKGVLKPGQQISQKEIAEVFGVSRIPVREAFAKLESTGFIEKRMNSRYFVQAFSMEEILDLYETRLILEIEGIKLAFPHYTQLDLISLESLLEKMKFVENSKDYILLNVEFHKLLVGKCPNKQIVSFIRQLWDGITLYTPSILTDKSQFPNGEHEAILKAIIDKDIEKLIIEYTNHIKNAQKKLFDYLSVSQWGE